MDFETEMHMLTQIYINDLNVINDLYSKVPDGLFYSRYNYLISVQLFEYYYNCKLLLQKYS
jgi:hypothetical protein